MDKNQKAIIRVAFFIFLFVWSIYGIKEYNTYKERKKYSTPIKYIEEGKIDSICTYDDIKLPTDTINWKDTALSKLKESEGFRSHVYRGLGGNKLIGYGFTYPHVWPRTNISKNEADIVLESKFNQYIKVAEGDGLKGPKSYAIADFIYNVGITRYRSSTLRKRIIDGSPDTVVCNELMRWVYAKGTKYKGLEKRRKWECKLYKSI